MIPSFAALAPHKGTHHSHIKGYVPPGKTNLLTRNGFAPPSTFLGMPLGAITINNDCVIQISHTYVDSV